MESSEKIGGLLEYGKQLERAATTTITQGGNVYTPLLNDFERMEIKKRMLRVADAVEKELGIEKE